MKLKIDIAEDNIIPILKNILTKELDTNTFKHLTVETRTSLPYFKIT